MNAYWMNGLFDGSLVEACMFNERGLTTESPDLLGYGPAKRSFKLQISIMRKPQSNTAFK